MTQAYTLDPDTGAEATLGVIALQVDETLERDIRHWLPGDDLAIYISRVPSGAELTVETIDRMATDLPAAASLLPQTPHYDVVAYACTSGTVLLGADRVTALVRSGCQAASVTTPLTAAMAAFQHLGVTSIGVVSPYVADVARPVEACFQDEGILVKQATHFGERVEAHVARISGASVMQAARAVAQDAEAVFLSCTNLRTLGLVTALEAELGLPVISSNTALCWHMAQLAGVERNVPAGGRLFEV